MQSSDLIYGLFSDEDFEYNDDDYLGSGAFAEVFKARLKKDRTGKALNPPITVAAKVLTKPPNPRISSRNTEILCKEAAILTRLKPHRNVVGMRGLSPNPKHFVLLLEHVNGGSLDEWLYLPDVKESPIDISSWKHRINIACQIAEGLAYLHANDPSIAHMDMKCSNILLQYENNELICKISDFGLSKMKGVSTQSRRKQMSSSHRYLRHPSGTSQHHSSPLAESHLVMGTSLYMAPEQFNYEVDTSSELCRSYIDIYSFGLILWEIRERAIIFEGMPLELIVGHKNKETIPMNKEQFPGCPEEYQLLIRDCYNKNPEKRPRSSDILERLKKMAKMLAEQQQHSFITKDKRKDTYAVSSLPAAPGNMVQKNEKTKHIQAEKGRKQCKDGSAATNPLDIRRQSRSRSGSKIGLPGKSAYFCGRNTELHQILLECFSHNVNLCCITGPTGIGKSSLVAEIAHRVRDGEFSFKTPPSSKWNVLYLDARNLETELQFATELLVKMKACFRDLLPAHIVGGASIKTDKSVKLQLKDIVSNMLYLCIILDNCDQALKEENRVSFLCFLQELTTATKNYFMALITSCSEDVTVCFTLAGANVFHVRLGPLSDADSDSLFLQSCMRRYLHGITPVSQRETPITIETVESIRRICDGNPMLIRLAGAFFRRYKDSITQKELVHKLKKRPYTLSKEVSDMGFLSALYNLLPSHLQIFLHGLSLFTGSFTRQEGAIVFGRGPVTFGMEVLSPLMDYHLVSSVSEEITGDEMQYYVHGLIRNFLQKIGCSEKQFRYFQENYCLLQLKRIIALQRVYDRNPKIVTRKISGFQGILEQLTSLVKPTGNCSKVWGHFLRLVYNRNSFMKCFFPLELRRDLLKNCLSVCISQRSANSEPRIRIILADVLFDLDDLERASSSLDKVYSSLGSDAVKEKKTMQARYFLQKARLCTRKGDGNKAISILSSECRRGSIPVQAREHAECFIALGNAYMSIGKYQTAIENFSQALEWCKEFLGQESFKGSHPDTCNVLMIIGHCHFCIREYDESLCSFSEALSMHHYLESDVSSLALTHYQMGISRAALGKGEEAGKDFEEVNRLLVGFESISLVLLSRQVEAKLLFSQGARALKEMLNGGKNTKGKCKKGTTLLEEAADSFLKLTDSLTMPASIDSEMTLVLSENLSLLVVIHALLSNEKEQQECLSRLRQIVLDSESGLIRNCYVVSYVLRPELESARLIADLPEIISHLAFHSYVGKRLTASDAPRDVDQISEDDTTQFPLLARQTSDSSTDTECDDKEGISGKTSSANVDYEDDWEDNFQLSPVSSSSALSADVSSSPIHWIDTACGDAQSDTGRGTGHPFDISSRHSESCTSFFEASDHDSPSFLQTNDEAASGCTGAQVQILASSECLCLYVNEQLVTCRQEDTVSAQISVEGGNLILPLYGISLTIPPEAMKTTTSLVITLSLFVSDKAVNVGGKTAYVGLIELLPHKTIFSKPVTLRYELKHHHKLGVDCFDTQFHFLYGKGIDPSESYDFVGSLNSACRHASYKSMDLDLQEDSIQLSTLSFCRHCCVVLYKRFGITISFFVRPKGVPVGEREWELRIVISCSCSENLEAIQKEQEKIGFSFVDKRPLRCRELPYFASQRLEFSLSKDDDFTSNFLLRSKQNFFSGDDLRFVVESDSFRHLLISCFIKCSEQIDCTKQEVMIAYKYYESSVLGENVFSKDDVSVLLDRKESSHSNYSDSNSPSSRSRQRRKILEVRGCDRLTHTAPAAQHINGNDISKSSFESKLVKIKRKPVQLELINVSKHLSNDWKNVARRLGIEDQLIETIENDEKANERVYQMLLKWTQSQDESATVWTLCEALIEENRPDIARKVFLQEKEGLD